jgi:hypothetical protein
MQQGGIGQAQGGRHGRVAFVARGADRVVPAATGAQPARCLIQVPRAHLSVEEIERRRGGQARAGTHGSLRLWR